MYDICNASKLRSARRVLGRGAKRGIIAFVDEDGQVVLGNEQLVTVSLGNGFAVGLKMRNPWDVVGLHRTVSDIVRHRRHRWQNTLLAEVRAQRAMEREYDRKERDLRDRDDIEDARKLLDNVVTVAVP